MKERLEKPLSPLVKWRYARNEILGMPFDSSRIRLRILLFLAVVSWCFAFQKVEFVADAQNAVWRKSIEGSRVVHPHLPTSAAYRRLKAVRSSTEFDNSRDRNSRGDSNGRKIDNLKLSQRNKSNRSARRDSSLDWHIRQLERIDNPNDMEAWLIKRQEQHPSAKIAWAVRDHLDFVRYFSDRQAPQCIVLHLEHLDNSIPSDASVKIYTTGLFALANSVVKIRNNYVDSFNMAWCIMDRMKEQEVEPTTVTFAALFQCMRPKGPSAVLETMKRIEKRYHSISLDEAVYQAAILACRSNRPVTNRTENDKNWQTALQLMQQMQRKHRLQPTSKIYLAVLEVLSDTRKIPMIRSVIRQWINSKQDREEIDERIWATALNACARVGDFRQVADFMQEMETPNLRHCTSLLKAFANAGEGQLALDALNLMSRENKESNGTMHVPGCSKPLTLPAIDPDLIAINTGISAATRAGNYEAAQDLFDRLQNGGFIDPAADLNSIFSEKLLSPDRITYHSLLAGCNDPERAKKIIKDMRLSRRHRYKAIPPTSVSYALAIQACQRSASPDLETVNILLEWAKDDNVEPSEFMYGPAIWTAQRGGDLQRCVELFEEMKDAGCRMDGISMNGLLAALCDGHEETRAMDLFDRMKELNFHVSAVSLKRLVGLIDSSVAMSSKEKEQALLHIFNRMDIHERNIKVGSPVFETLITLYGSRGDIDKATNIADRIIGYMDAPCLRSILLAHSSCSAPRWKEAVEILHTSDIVEGASGPGLIDQIALSHVLVACSKANEFDEGLSLLHLYGLPTLKLPPGAPSMTVASINALIAACGRGGCPEISLAILNEMHSRFGIRPDSRSYRSAVIACNQAQHGNKIYGAEFDGQNRLGDDDSDDSYIEWWEISLALLERMLDEGLVPDVQTYSSVISACEAAGQWQRALGVLQSIIEEEDSSDKSQGVSLNLYCWNAAISACEKGGAWVEALDLYERMLENESIAPNFITLNSLLEALSNNGQKDLAQSKYDEGAEMGIVNPWRRTRNKQGETILALDLHKFSSAMAKAALRNTLDRWLDESDAIGGLSEDLVIITGKGLNSAADPVLQSAAKEVLSEYEIQGVIDRANTGRIIVDIESLLECFGDRSW